MNTPTSFWFLVRYGIVGVTGGVLQTFTLYVWVDLAHLGAHYLWGAALGFCIALAATFLLQKYWTFRDYANTEAKRQFVLYTGIALLNLGLTMVFLRLSKFLLERSGIDFFDRWYLIAQILIIVFLAGASFVANYFLTFRKRPDRVAEIVSDGRA